MRVIKRLAPMLFTAVLLVGSGAFTPAEALLASHDCSYCHDFHGNPGYSTLLIAENSELVCLSCHTVDINSTKSAAVHNPGGLASDQPGYITCRECHDAHSSSGSNVKMVGYKRDAQNWSANFTAPGVRKELPSTVGLTYNVVTYTGPTDFNIAGSTVGACETCHASNHKVGKDCTLCHGHNSGFPSAGTGCLGCHDGTDGDAPVVTYDSPHSKNTIFGVTGPDTFDCVDCHTNHGSGTVEIPNNSAVGIQYSQNGEQGIALGSTKVTGNTEAEICWNCHATYGVSEWGVNTDTNGVGFPNYDSGSLNQRSWVGATWSSANFTFKSGSIQSTHSANSAGANGVDAVGDIRCSYCHDVHELNTLASDTTSGKPYLRGTWAGSPYNEDGAPLAGTNYGNVDGWGSVPRATPNQTVMGGYWIDQNSGSPTADVVMDSPDKFAGLCELCHGLTNAGDGTTKGDGTWGSTEIDKINQYNTDTAAWVSGSNGHANMVKGASGSTAAARNIFDLRGGTLLTAVKATGGTDSPAMSFMFANGATQATTQPGNDYSAEYGFRSANGGSFVTGLLAANQLTAGANDKPNMNGTSAWGADMTGATTQSSYHTFTCSKCHNPHASRLPKLMITNCLDTKHNTWDDALPLNDRTGINLDRSASNWSSAQNCHRLGGVADGTGPEFVDPGAVKANSSNGWNNVTPWTSEGTQDSYNPGTM